MLTSLERFKPEKNIEVKDESRQNEGEIPGLKRSLGTALAPVEQNFDK